MEEYEEYVAGMRKMEGAHCYVCPEGRLKLSTTVVPLERECPGTGRSVTIVVKDVPALVCDTCGDASYTEAVSLRLDDILEEAEADGVEVAVRRFTPQPTDSRRVEASV